MTIARLLIANRGEIAVRIASTAARLGIATIAVHSDADANAPHTRVTDLAIGIGGDAPADSYLRIDKLLLAARDSGADAVHPGYGFLSENADFARACQDAGLVFVGPPPEAIAAMANKSLARERMRAAGVPVLEGYDGEDQSDTAFAAAAQRIGYPVMIKAAAGGGGRGMRLVAEDAAFSDALAAARAEAAKAFGDDRLLLECAVTRARHVEAQIFADRHGAVVFLGERDCSLQRRHQKLIEEAPAPGLAQATRQALAEAAIAAARAVNYVGAGTVEFLLDPAGRVTFMEMNTRLQVEHPVSEAVSGLDLVEWQLRVARGERLPLAQAEIHLSGHAIEARLVAEDAAEFLPGGGLLRDVELPAGTRIDHAIAPGLVVSPHYDSLLAKVIAHGATREEARLRLIGALKQLTLLGVPSNRAFLIRALADEAFAAGALSTGFIAERFPKPEDRSPQPPAEVLALALALAATGAGRAPCPLGLPTGWTNAHAMQRPVTLRLGGRSLSGRVVSTRDGHEARFNNKALKVHFIDAPAARRGLRASIDGAPLAYRVAPAGEAEFWLKTPDGDFHLRDTSLEAARGATAAGGVATGAIAAPMHARLASLRVAVGERVATGAVIATIEAMKLEHALTAALPGVVAALHAVVGQALRPGDLVATIAPDAGGPAAGGPA